MSTASAYCPRPSVVVSTSLLCCSLCLFANYWVDAFETDEEVRQIIAGISSVPFFIAIVIYKSFPAPGRGVGKMALSLGPIQFVAGASVPLGASSLPKSGHAYCVMFWSISHTKPVERMETLCRAVSSDLMHFIAVSPDEPDRLERFAKASKVKKKPLTLPFAADSAGTAFDNWMFHHGEHGVPHAFVVGTDGVIAWHGHPNRPALIEHLRKIIQTFPARAPAASPPGSKASAEEKKKA